jgi:hypothetical protein
MVLLSVAPILVVGLAVVGTALREASNRCRIEIEPEAE